MAPLEVEAADAAPRLAPVGGAPRRLIEAAGVERRRAARIERHVVDVLGAREHVAPGGAGVGRDEDPAPRVVLAAGHAPGREVEPLRVRGVDGEGVGPVGARRQLHTGPVLGAVGGAVERAVAVVADAAPLAPPRDHQVQRAVAGPRDAPREGLPLREAGVLERPGPPVVGGLVEAVAEAAGVERARARGAGRVEQHVRDRGLGHARVRERPAPPAVGRRSHAALVRVGIGAPPHLGTGQVVGAAEGAPHAPPHVGVEGDPVRGVAPRVGDAHRRADPGLAAVLAAEEADVGVGDEDSPGIERIEVDAVAARDIQASRRPGPRPRRGVDLGPRLPAVERAVRAKQVGDVADVRVARRGGDVVGRVVPDVAAHLPRPLFDPGSGHVLGRPIGLAVDDAPGLAPVLRLRDAVEEAGRPVAEAEPAEARVGRETVAGRGRDRVQLRRLALAGLLEALPQTAVGGAPRPPAVFRDMDAPGQLASLPGGPGGAVEDRALGAVADAPRVEAPGGRAVEVAPALDRALPGPRLAEGEHLPVGHPESEHALGGERGHAGPGAAPVGRGDDDRAVPQRRRRTHAAHGEGGVEPVGVGRIDGDGVDRHPAVAGVGGIVGAERLVRVVGAAVLHGVLRRVRPHHAPAPPRVLAPPERAGAGVDHVRVLRVEGVGADDVAQVEHPPRGAGIAGQVRAGHVAPLDDEPGVVGADGGPQHGAAASGTEDPPGVEARRGGPRRDEGQGQAGRRQQRRPSGRSDRSFHRDLPHA